MAEFNPQVNPDTSKSFLGYSRELDKPRPNRSYEILFEGLANTLDAGVTAVDQHNMRDIEKQAFEGVDAIRGEFGVDAATDAASDGGLFGGGSNRPLPGGAKNAQREVEKLTRAFQDGQLSDSYYWGRVNALSKQIRNQYPGYRPEIDQIISGITGANPANALRNSIQSEFESAQAATRGEVDKKESLIDRNVSAIQRANPDMLVNPQNYSIAEVREVVGRVEGYDASLRTANAELSRLASTNKLTADATYSDTIFQGQKYVSSLLAPAMASLGKDIQAKVQSGEILDPEQLAQVQGALTVARAQALEGLRANIINRPFDDEEGKSRASVIADPTKIKQAEDAIMSTFDDLIDMVNNGDVGLAARAAQMVKGYEDTDQARLLRSSEPARQLVLARNIAGPAFPVVINGMVETLDETTRDIHALNFSQAVQPQGAGVPTPQQMLERTGRRENGGKVTQQDADAFIDGNVKLMTNSELSIEARANAAAAMFAPGNDGFLDNFPASYKKNVFSRLVSPEVTKSIEELKDTNPDVYNNYRDWALNSFQSVFRAESGEIQQAFEFNDRYRGELTFDPNTLQYTLTPPTGAIASEFNRRFSGYSHERKYRALYGAVENMNNALTLMKPLLGDDPSALAQTLSQINPEVESQDYFLERFFNGVGEFFSGSDEEGAGEGTNPLADSPAAGAEESSALVVMDDVEEDTLVQMRDTFSGGTLDENSVAGAIQQLVRKAEGTTESYNVMYGGSEADLTNMTIDEVLEFQREFVRQGSPSSAAGAYQIMPYTLRDLKQILDLDGSEKFDEEMQDKLFMALLERRGFSKWQSGDLSKNAFINNLSKEWAGLPNTRNVSNYAGDGLNKSTIDIKEVLNKFETM